MFQRMASRMADAIKIFRVHTDCQTQVSWFENLKRGIYSLIIHPFLPLLDTGFNYPYLFFGNLNPCNETKLAQETSIQSKSILRMYYDVLRRRILETLDSLGIYSLPSDVKQKFASSGKDLTRLNLKDKLANYAKSKSIKIFLIAQLIVCTILLINFIIRDLRRLIFYIRHNK